jgi:quinoprotein glucose dehydrogenase
MQMIRVVVFAILLLLPRANAQTDWPDFGHDKGAQRYSVLKQINVGNVSLLAPAWTYPMKNEGDAQGSVNAESVPLVVDSHMYLSWPFCQVAELDPETGRQLWRTPRHVVLTGAMACRPCEAWPIGQEIR